MRKIERILVYILALALTVEVCLMLELEKQNDATVKELATHNAALQADIEEIIQESSKYELQIRELSDRVKELRRDKPDRSGEREPEFTSLGTYTVTAYCSCEKCCGEYAKNRPQGKVYGAAGVELTAGVSVAGWLPLGTQIMIDGNEYTVQDRTAAWIREKYDGRIIDIYFDSHKAARAWGKQKFEVFEVMQ